MEDPQQKLSFFCRIKNLISSIYDDNKVPFKLVGIVDKDGEKCVIIKLTGSYITINEPAAKAVADDKILSGLSPQDIRSLSFFVMYEHMKKEINELREALNHQYKHELLGIKFNDANMPEVTILDIKEDRYIEMNLEEIFKNKELLESLKHECAFTLGYLKCLYEQHKEKGDGGEND